MKTTELITLLQESLATNGDLPVRLSGDNIADFDIVPEEAGYPAYLDLVGK